MIKDEKTVRGSFWRGLTLPQLFALIILPLTLFSMVVAIGSIAVHQQAMRAQLPESAWKTATDPALELTLVALVGTREGPDGDAAGTQDLHGS